LYHNLCFAYVQPGTYLYHAHYGMQREAGLYGSIRVSVPDGVSEPFAYDYDRSIILNDWYHKSVYEQATGLSSIPFVWVGEPQVTGTTCIVYVTNRISIIFFCFIV
jgi:FtsP/CotA-like multicopper oxidase with cupredoxin domain